VELGPKFDEKTSREFRNHKDRKVILSIQTWNHVIEKPERKHIELNFDLIADAIKSPDLIKRSVSNKNSEIWYKTTSKVWIRPGISVSGNGYVALVVKVRGYERYIQTIYFCQKPKRRGEMIWPEDRK
jgi:hypothetical protein